MFSKSTLFRAKAYLCWDVFPNLSVQLVPLQKEVGYYFPPKNDMHTIVLFYDDDADDFSGPLFLLFHEAGHVRQSESSAPSACVADMMQIAVGKQRIEFELAAWKEGRRLFYQFAKKEQLDPATALPKFDAFAQRCISTYSTDDGSE